MPISSRPLPSLGPLHPFYRTLLLPLLALGPLGACQSLEEPTGEPFEAPEATPADEIGYFLAEFDGSLRRWNELKLAPSSDRDRRQLRALETNMKKRASERQEDLVTELETGPPLNRQVAAAALGFTGDPAVISALLNALDDPNAGVVQKALLGLGRLEDPSTPPGPLLEILRSHPDPWTRNNAVYAVQRVVAAGAASEDVATTCRAALVDPEPGVRAQAASVLGMVRDAESVDALGDLLQDEVQLVYQAAATALARIGRDHPESKGQVARLLVQAMDEGDSGRRKRAHRELVVLSDRDLGDEPDDWREWAYRMP